MGLRFRMTTKTAELPWSGLYGRVAGKAFQSSRARETGKGWEKAELSKQRCFQWKPVPQSSRPKTRSKFTFQHNDPKHTEKTHRRGWGATLSVSHFIRLHRPCSLWPFIKIRLGQPHHTQMWTFRNEASRAEPKEVWNRTQLNWSGACHINCVSDVSLVSFTKFNEFTDFSTPFLFYLIIYFTKNKVAVHSHQYFLVNKSVCCCLIPQYGS